MFRNISKRSEGTRGVSPEQEKEGYDGKDLQKKMTVLSGESMSFVLIALASVVNSTVLDSDLLRRRCPLYVPQRGSFARPLNAGTVGGVLISLR